MLQIVASLVQRKKVAKTKKKRRRKGYGSDSEEVCLLERSGTEQKSEVLVWHASPPTNTAGLGREPLHCNYCGSAP